MEDNLNEDTCKHTIKPRYIPPQNIVHRLRKRETFGAVHPGTHFHVAREFHQNVFPNFTIINVEKPPCFLRKFSPDGQYFIAFSSDQTSLEIYEYQGCSAAADLVQNCKGEYIGHTSDRESEYIRSSVFSRFFKIKYTVNVAQSGEQLNRECSLFTDDGRYVIVGSAAFIPDDLRPHFYEIYTNNESVTPNPRSPLEDYSLHLVDIQAGRLCDTKMFKVDKIFLSHNQGLYLYKDTLAVLSVQHQTIHIFQLCDGMFISVRTIGRFCYEDDDFILSPVSNPGQNSINYRAFREKSINCMKHRLLVFLFKRAKHISDTTNDPYELRKFYQYFDQFRALRMWRMQLLDENHLLVKYASEDIVTLKATEANAQSSFFVVYNIVTTEVIAVYENTSEELLELFENFCDLFRNVKLHSESQFTCSPSNNIYARVIQQRCKQTFVSARFGGVTEATKRMLTQLPISAQSYSCSPYLDLSLFSYDDKWVSVMERPKACGEHPIRFYGRDSGLLKFRIYAGVLGRSPPPAARRLVAFTFHPRDPFAISVQRTNAEYVVNFHIRHV
ncbi:DET1 homolog [Schistocerca americana]|uniref:DET1 homolog n=1 Tax=Schistocerca americana TaxID=7009 RepID=UPI001F5028F2|nr:DET1 homolog [Schistocerca americana]XP_047096741.1 DET1 homolog isoform X1 [Schistocerca piceifrons]XP_049765890.1 DET1 homolog isoform X1 [Schistocerca cancellata]XP_049790981.1 DET1 homolog isoform X1 [Schistocerca nitens]XP_049837459.1 DET1 homolog isoform X1 [Schistocerca gregaria]XP_049937793.1 DET1 homolog [Schistocerca serialis cubense]